MVTSAIYGLWMITNPRARDKVFIFVDGMWHGQWVVNSLNGETPDPTREKQNAARYLLLEESFLQEHQKIEGICAQGIRLPE